MKGIADLVRAVAAAYIILVGANSFYHIVGYANGCHKMFTATIDRSKNEFLEGYFSARIHIKKFSNLWDLLTPLEFYLLPPETIDESLKTDTSSHQSPNQDINKRTDNKYKKGI